MRFTGHQFIKFAPAVHPASYGAAAQALGVAVDTQGYEEAVFIVHLGAATATGDVSFEVHESATSGGAYTKITGSELPATGDFDTTEDDRLYVLRVSAKDHARFLKLAYDVDDDAVIFGASCALLLAKTLPVTQIETAVSVG